jgi:hypothetical protein
MHYDSVVDSHEHIIHVAPRLEVARREYRFLSHSVVEPPRDCLRNSRKRRGRLLGEPQSNAGNTRLPEGNLAEEI